MENGEFEEVDVDEVNVGNILLVKTGAKVPVDGTVLTGGVVLILLTAVFFSEWMNMSIGMLVHEVSILVVIIAPVYGLFFRWQVRNYRNILADVKDELDFSTCRSVIDIGCGTGALCRVLHERSEVAWGIYQTM